MSNPEKLSLFIMGQKGLSVLKALAAEFGPEIIFSVIGAKDKNIETDHNDEIQLFCSTYTIRYFDRHDTLVVALNTFAIGWRWMISDCPNLVVFHDSLLPKYRGFSPLVNSLINKEPKIGVTALRATLEYDTGNILGQSSVSITHPLKISKAIDAIVPLYIELAISITKSILSEVEIEEVAQDNHQATYSIWRDELDYLIDWKDSAENVLRFIYAVGFPYKGASTILNGRKVRILDAELVRDEKIESRPLGKTIFMRDGKPVVICGSGLLKITEIIDDVQRTSVLPLSSFRNRFST